MQLFGIGKKASDSGEHADEKPAKNPASDLKHQVKKYLTLASRYETTIIAITVAALLAITSMRMLRYMDPQVEDSQVQEILAKNKKNRIDLKTVDKLKELHDSNTTTPVKAQSGRTNPFTE